MDIGGIGELISTLRESAGYLMTGAVVMFFALLAALLWTWRGTALDDDGDEAG